MSKVTVVMPAYQHEKYVGQAIESVLNQSYTDFEFLIGDDASGDGTLNVISSYKDPRIHVFSHQKNHGATWNHRFLLNNAVGDYIALINSDDLWLPGRLEKQVAYMEQHPEAVMCSCWALMIDEGGNELELGENVFEQPNRTQAEWIEYFFCHGNCICHPGTLIRTSAGKKVDYYHMGMRQLPDFDFWTRLILEGEFYIFQEPMVTHRRFLHSGENTSTPKPENSVRDVIESYYVLTELIEKIPDQLFLQAFHKYLRDPDSRSEAELCCEKFFVLASGIYYMPKIYKQAAIMYFLRHYNMDMASIMEEKYQYMLNDFYQLSCQVDLLGLLSATESNPTVVPSQEEIAISFIYENRLKAIAVALLKKNSYLYKLGKRIYRKIFKRKDISL